MELEIYNQDTLDKKLMRVEKMLQDKKVLLAYSGGVDSTVMAYLSRKYADEVLLVMQTGNSVAIGEKEFATKQAEQLKLQIEFIEYDEVDYSDDYQQNPANRCYYCKELLHNFLNKIKLERGYDIVVSGTNYSDLSGHRPGHQAAVEAGVVNPLVDAKITKQEIRWIAADAGLDAWDKPASACLASRFITGISITKEGLQRVAKSEHFIKNNFDVRVLRVRDHGKFARIEVGEDELDKFLDKEAMLEISNQLKKFGYNYVTLDMEGYRPATPV